MCLGALIGTVSGSIVAAVIPVVQFDTNFEQAAAWFELSFKEFNEEQVKAQDKRVKTQGVTETLARGACNRAAAGLSPFAVAAVYT